MADQRTSNQSQQTSAPSSTSRQSEQLSRTSPERSVSRQSRIDPLELMPDPREFFLNPFSAMRRFEHQMQRMFGSQATSQTAWIPAIEVAEKGNNFVVRAELPGISDKDVRVEASDNALILQGEKRIENEQTEEGGIRRTERQYGQFYRTIPLPEGADPDDARAEFKDGVLEITVPLAENRRRQIQIGSGTTKQTQDGKKAA